MEIDHIQLQNTVQTLLRNEIQSMEQLKRLTDDEIKALKSVGTKKFKEIKSLIDIGETIDVFKYFGPNSIMPKSMRSFFNKHKIYQGNILETKLAELGATEKLTKGRIKAFLDFKNDVFCDTYNDTLDAGIQQFPNEITDTLIQHVTEPLKKYLSAETVATMEKDLEQMINAIGFKQIDLDTYGEKIATQLDVEHMLMKKQNDFDKEILYQVIFKERKEMSMFKLKQQLKTIGLFNMNRLTEVLYMLLEEGFITYTSHGVKHQYPSIVHYVKSKITEFPHIYERLQGKTLEEIGAEEGLTRERIRQKVIQESKKLPMNRMYEWRFVPFYQSYHLTQEEFCQVFQLNNEQYNFLKVFFTADQLIEMGTKEELLESNKLGAKEQEQLLHIINKNYLIIDNHRLRKNKLGIVSYAVKLFAQESIHIEDFQEKLINFCEQAELDVEFDFSEIRALEGVISRVEASLWKYGKQLRYYAVDQDVVVYMLNQINFDRYMNQEISTKRILLDYPDIFQTIDIRDEYELHNLLKRNEALLPDKVNFKRMPLLEIGTSDREEQLLSLLIEHSPINRNEFAEIYSEKYGVLPETVKANYVPLLKEFEDNFILDADTPVINPKTLNQLRSLLTEDLYFKEDVYQLYEEKFGDDTLRDYMFQFVDYMNFAEFILKKEHERADVYFEKNYFSQPMFTIHDNRMKYLGSFRKSLESLRDSLDIFEYAENEFIHIQTIQEKTGIGKIHIQTLIDEILNEVGDKYFTVPMIEPIIEQSPLYTLGFDDTFYEFILKGNEHLRFQYMGKRAVFRKTADKFYIYELIEETVARMKFVDIHELMNHLNEEYSITLSREKIIQSTEMTDLFYHPVLEMMFQDMEQFYEFMEED